MAFSAQRLTEALRRKGMSARAAARELKRVQPDIAITHAYISQLASGKSDNPSVQVVAHLARLLDVTQGWLLGEDPPPPPLSAEDQRLEEQIRQGAAELGVEYIAERASGLSGMSLEALAKMIEAMRHAEGLDRPTDEM